MLLMNQLGGHFRRLLFLLFVGTSESFQPLSPVSVRLKKKCSHGQAKSVTQVAGGVTQLAAVPAKVVETLGIGVGVALALVVTKKVIDNLLRLENLSGTAQMYVVGVASGNFENSILNTYF